MLRGFTTLGAVIAEASLTSLEISGCQFEPAYIYL